MKLQDNPYLPTEMGPLVRQLDNLLRQTFIQINQLSGGEIVAVNAVGTAAPTGTAINYKVGDEVRNLSPAVLGTAGSRYVIRGWICVTAGAPGTWAEQRTLTGT